MSQEFKPLVSASTSAGAAGAVARQAQKEALPFRGDDGVGVVEAAVQERAGRRGRQAITLVDQSCYLSWKRRGASAAPWGWRIKVPLSPIAWAEIRAAERDGMALTRDVTGCRPRTSEPVDWRVEPISG